MVFFGKFKYLSIFFIFIIGFVSATTLHIANPALQQGITITPLSCTDATDYAMYDLSPNTLVIDESNEIKCYFKNEGKSSALNASLVLNLTIKDEDNSTVLNETKTLTGPVSDGNVFVCGNSYYASFEFEPDDLKDYDVTCRIVTRDANLVNNSLTDTLSASNNFDVEVSIDVSDDEFYLGELARIRCDYENNGKAPDFDDKDSEITLTVYNDGDEIDDCEWDITDDIEDNDDGYKMCKYYIPTDFDFDNSSDDEEFTLEDGDNETIEFNVDVDDDTDEDTYDMILELEIDWDDDDSSEEISFDLVVDDDFDDDEKEITIEHPDDDDIYLTITYQKQYGVDAGDDIDIEIEVEYTNNENDNEVVVEYDVYVDESNDEDFDIDFETSDTDEDETEFECKITYDFDGDDEDLYIDSDKSNNSDSETVDIIDEVVDGYTDDSTTNSNNISTTGVDLGIVSLEINSPIIKDKFSLITCIIQNGGNTRATNNFDIKWYLDGQLMFTSTKTEDLDSFETLTFNYNHKFVTTGKHNVKCEVKYNGTDISSTNNTKEKEYTVLLTAETNTTGTSATNNYSTNTNTIVESIDRNMYILKVNDPIVNSYKGGLVNFTCNFKNEGNANLEGYEIMITLNDKVLQVETNADAIAPGNIKNYVAEIDIGYDGGMLGCLIRPLDSASAAGGYVKLVEQSQYSIIILIVSILVIIGIIVYLIFKFQ